MKTRFFILLFLAFVNFTQAQTTYTFTGAGSGSTWSNSGNWDANGVPASASNNTDIIIINSYCSILWPNSSLFLQRPNTHLIINNTTLNISNPANADMHLRFNLITLNTSTLWIEGESIYANEVGYINNTEIEGNGTVRIWDNNFQEDNSIISNVTFSPGTATTKGLLDLRLNEMSACKFNIDVFGTPTSDNYDKINFGLYPSISSNVFSTELEVVANGYTPAHNDLFVAFTRFLNFDQDDYIGGSISSNFQAQGYDLAHDFIDGSNTGTIKIVDTEAPSITNCPSTASETADCGIYLGVPDYTTGLTATDNDSGAITYSQTPAPGSGVTDGTVITLTATDAAGNSSSCNFSIDVTPNVLRVPAPEDMASSFRLYPNPSNGSFTLENSERHILKYAEVVDIKGVSVFKLDLNTSSLTKSVTLNNLSSGIYLFKIYTADGFVTKKLIID